MLTAECPKPVALTEIPSADECAFRISQILKLNFQRVQPVGASSFKTGTPITAAASWTAAKAATDSKKIVISPICDSVEIPSSEAQTEGGGDNSTPFGVQIYLGEGQVTVTGQFRNLNKKQIKALRKLSGESAASLGAAALSVIFTTEGRVFVHSTEDDTENSDPVGFPIFNFRLGSTGAAGLNQDNKTPFSFSMLADWDERMTISKPAFDPLIQL
jgi:hypothetical protein